MNYNYDMDDFFVDNDHLFGGNSQHFGEGFYQMNNSNELDDEDWLNGSFSKKKETDKIKSWLINLETKDTKLIIDDIEDGEIPDMIKDYDWVLELEIDSQKIKNIKNLPKNIKNLSLFNNYIENIHSNVLPESLETINLARNKIQTLQNIPKNVKELDVSHNLIRHCYLLTNINLEELSIEANLLDSFPLFCNGIKKIDISQNKLKNLFSLVDSIEELDISLNEVTYIPKLPENLKRLNAFNNKIENILCLNDKLEYIDFSYNKVTTLPFLPKTIEKADFSGNNIQYISTLYEDNNLFEGEYLIDLSNNPLDKIPESILKDKHVKHTKMIKDESLKLKIDSYENIKLNNYIEINMDKIIVL
jgi:hypothetical protein